MYKKRNDFFNNLRLTINEILEMGDKHAKKISRFYFIETNDFINNINELNEYYIINSGITKFKTFKNMIFIYEHNSDYDSVIFGDYAHDGVIVGIDIAIYNFYNRINERKNLENLIGEYLIKVLKEGKYKEKGMKKRDFSNVINTELFNRVTNQSGYLLNYREFGLVIQDITDYAYKEYTAKVFNETWDFKMIDSFVMMLDNIINYENNNFSNKLNAIENIMKDNCNSLGYYDNICVQYAKKWLEMMTERNVSFVTEDKYRIRLINQLKQNKLKSFCVNTNSIPVSESFVVCGDSILDYGDEELASRVKTLFNEQTYIGLVNKANVLIDSIDSGVDPKFINEKLQEFKVMASRVKFLANEVTVNNVDKLLEETLKTINNKYTNGVNLFVI